MGLLRTIKGSIRTLGLGLVFGHKSSSSRFQAWLRSQGVKVGQDVHFYSPWTISVDTQRPWMIEIGDHVHITAGVSILQHDYSWAVVQRMSGEVLGAAGKVRIGDNAFIGQRTILLKGADVGHNTIVGAGSVVTGRLLANSVYAGVPARRLMGIDEFVVKRRAEQLKEAELVVRSYRDAYHQDPPIAVMGEFLWLFSDSAEGVPDEVSDVLRLSGDFDRSARALADHESMFANYESFLEACGEAK